MLWQGSRWSVLIVFLFLSASSFSQDGFDVNEAGMTVQLRPSKRKPSATTKSAAAPTASAKKKASAGSKSGKERGYSLCVTADSATLRSEPTADSPVSWKVGKFMPFKKVEAQGGWLKVSDLENKEHWIAKGAVGHFSGCTVVLADRVPMYKTPEPTGPKSEAAAAEKYQPFRILGKQGAYTHVQDQLGEKFWISTASLWTP